MDTNFILSLLKDFGFPVVVCAALFWQQNKTMKDFSDKMEGSFSALNKSVSDNTIATTQLVATVDTLAKVGDN